jgi:hypothetical protein
LKGCISGSTNTGTKSLGENKSSFARADTSLLRLSPMFTNAFPRAGIHFDAIDMSINIFSPNSDNLLNIDSL